MRVLFCSYSAPLPPTVNGHRVYAGNLVPRLAARHDVRVLALIWPDQEPGVSTDLDLRVIRAPPAPAEGPLARVTTYARSWARGLPAGVRSASEALREPFREEIAGFQPDVVHVTAGSLAPLARELAGVPSVLAALDAQHLNEDAAVAASSGPRKGLWRVEAALMRRFEGRTYGRFGCVVVVSEHDANALRAIDPLLDARVIPLGVDADRYVPPPGVERVPGRILFTGVLNYAPNVSAAERIARRILPRVAAAVPEAHLCLVGRAPLPRVRALGELDGVEVLADVAEMPPWFASASVYACPMATGTGMKIKILEAFAAGTPAVASPLALRGIQPHPERDVLVAEDDDEIAAKIVRLLRDPPLAAAIGHAGREYVRRMHTWAGVVERYESLYEDLVGA
jgi:glycosyltransferase involved in cell wall biosynthesis